MKPRHLTIVDGHAEGQRTRFGKFAASVIDGGTVRDEDCRPATAGGLYLARSAFVVSWVECRDYSDGVSRWAVGFFFTIAKARRVADELNRARALGIMDAFR